MIAVASRLACVQKQRHAHLTPCCAAAAAYKGDLAHVKRLVDNKIDPNAAAYDKRTALHLASSEVRHSPAAASNTALAHAPEPAMTVGIALPHASNLKILSTLYNEGSSLQLGLISGLTYACRRWCRVTTKLSSIS
jgi:hypothetical protein